MGGVVEGVMSRILFVDDDSDALLSLVRALKVHGLTAQVDAFSSIDRAEKYLLDNKPEVAVIDLCLTQEHGVESGFSLLKRILDFDFTCRVIVLTGHGSVEHGIRALKAGAANFLEKPADPQHLLALIRDGIKQAGLKRAYERLRLNQDISELNTIVGISQKIRKVREGISFAASTNQSVLITGETGTGKGLCAAVLHRLSARKERRLIRYQPNYGTADLVNSDLFGHKRGAFTGADKDRKGLLSEANGSTLFLDEVDELPLETQVALLGVLQDGSFRSIGCNQEERVDFRLISASNQDIRRCLAEKKLRSDFYHRIAHFRLELPALRERCEDILVLAQLFLEQLRNREQLNVTGIEDEAVSLLERYDWPGNVRELQAAVGSAAYRAQYDRRTEICVSDLSFGIGANAQIDFDFESQVSAYKTKLINDALLRNGGNQVHAARELRIDRSTLRRIMARAGVFDND